MLQPRIFFISSKFSNPVFYSGQQTVRTKQTYLDVSDYSRNVEDSYFLSVKAELNGSLSKPSESVEFTYDEDFAIKIKCKYSKCLIQ